MKKLVPCPFGAILRQEREARGMSQKQLAQRIGRSPQQVNRMEQGDREPMLSTLVLLAAALDMTVGDLAEQAVQAMPVLTAGAYDKNEINDMSSPCLFGAALATILKKVNMSACRLAQVTGLTEDYINKIIHNKREPRAGTILRIERALPVPPGDLIDEMDRLTREYEKTGVLPAIVQDLAAHRRKN